MQIEIIPTILVKNFEEVKEKIKQVENLVDWVQLDIMDGVFVNNETWDNPKDLKKIKTKLKLEAHLMVQKPEEVIDDWLEVVDRVIIHFESKITNRELGIRGMIEKAHKRGKQIGLAINPETPIDVVRSYISTKRSDQPSEQSERSTILDIVLCMAVQPGLGGQEFKYWVLKKIEILRRLWPSGNIEVDGGINPETAKKTIKAGANLICAGTYIFRSKDIEKAIESLKI